MRKRKPARAASPALIDNIEALYRALNPPTAETLAGLKTEMADDLAITDLQCHAWDTHWPDPEDRSSRLYRVTDFPRGLSHRDQEEVEWESGLAQRAARYLILRGRLQVVQHDGKPWVRILPGSAS